MKSEPLLKSRLDMLRGVALSNPLSRHSAIMVELLDEVDRLHAQNNELREQLKKLRATLVANPLNRPKPKT